MKSVSTLMLAFILLGGAMSQSCLPDGIHFETQAQIDSFQINYPECSEIEGSVIIGAVVSSDISNLNNLDVLSSIGGALVIDDNNLLENLSGLDGLSSIGGNLAITNNESLISITALGELKSVGGNIHIKKNTNLTTLAGLEDITSIEGYLEIEHNYALMDIAGFVGVASINGYLGISFNYALTSLSGLDNLKFVGGSVWITCNYKLKTLTGLENLSYINGYLKFHSNEVLTSLEALSELDSIAGKLEITWNDSLTSLQGLDSIDAGSITELNISRNLVLSNCELPSICDYLSNPSGEIYIQYNYYGCNSLEDVEEACESYSVKEHNNLHNTTIYPNPAHATITIEFPTQPSKNTSLTISNINGQQLINQAITEPQTEIDLTHLPDGIYIVKVWNDKGVMVRKVIKQ